MPLILHAKARLWLLFLLTALMLVSLPARSMALTVGEES